MRSCLPYMQTVQEAAKGKRSMLSYIDMPTKNDCHNALEKNQKRTHPRIPNPTMHHHLSSNQVLDWLLVEVTTLHRQKN